MSAEYMKSCIDDYLKKLGYIHTTLEHFSVKLNEKRDGVFRLIGEFQKSSSAMAGNLDAENARSNTSPALKKAAKDAFSRVEKAVSEWSEQIQKNNKGTTFMEKNQKYLTVMVFGAVKAGKSTLGNFFAGKDFREAPFDNAFKDKNCPEAVFATEDTRRQTGGIVKGKDGRSSFAVGLTDTTGNIQFFSLSGLRWIDSPGTGAVAKSGDDLKAGSMDDMVKEYIPYTDLCIFLMNSSEPGLQEDMKYIKLLEKENQSALVLITRSDISDEDVDENGDIVSVLMPKPDETRRLQENWVCEEIKTTYPDISPYKYNALSVSTMLSENGIRDQDDDTFRAGNLDRLMKIISDKANSDIVRLKEIKPQKNLNAFIANIISGSEGSTSISTLRKVFSAMQSGIDESQGKLEKKKEQIVRIIGREVENSVRRNIRNWAGEVDSSGTELGDAEIGRRIQALVNPLIDDKLNEAIGDVISDYQSQSLSPLELKFSGGGLHKETKTIEKKYTETYVRTRRPDGIIETVCSWFGKEYYTHDTREVVKRSTYDLGTNVDAYIRQISPQIAAGISKSIADAVDEVRNTYFASQQKYIGQMLAGLDSLEKNLSSYTEKV